MKSRREPKRRSIANQTPFYAESGGQVGDSGVLFTPGASSARHGQKLAMCSAYRQARAGALSSATVVEMQVDGALRTATRANHSATHLVHEALRRVLGPHVTQKGQMVDAERLRFDFSHNAPVTEDELARMEDEVNAVIRQNLPAETRMMAPQEAIAAGAVALFGEKYGDEVRVLTLGHSLIDDTPYSVELCGGTHVARTGDIALFKIVSETGIAAGVRRIEALTGEAARQFLLAQAGVAKTLAQSFKVQPADVPARVEALTADRKALEKQVADAEEAARAWAAVRAAAPRDAGAGIRRRQLRRAQLDGVNPKDLRGLVDDAKKQVGSGVVAFVAVSEDGKGAIAVGVTSGPDGEIQRRRSGEGRFGRNGRRLRRRRTARHGAGRRSRRRQGRGGARGGEGGAGGGGSLSPCFPKTQLWDQVSGRRCSRFRVWARAGPSLLCGRGPFARFPRR